MMYDYIAQVLNDAQSLIQQLSKQEQLVEDAHRDKNLQRQAEEECKKLREKLLKPENAVQEASFYFCSLATQRVNSDEFRSAWQKKASKKDELSRLSQWNLEKFYKDNWHVPTINLSLLPPCSFFLQFTFTLAKPYLSKDDNPFYIIDNPIVRDKVFGLPMVRPTSWKGNLYSALWQMEHDKHSDEQMQRLFGETRGEEGGQSGRLYFYPTFFTQTGLEIINPHDRKRRVGKNPILFECVPAGASGTFSLLYVPFDLIGQPEEKIRQQTIADLQLVAKGIQAMMLCYGFSAKRTSGYGVAEDSVKTETVPAKLVIKLTGVTFSQANTPPTQQPAAEFHKYLDENGRVKTAFTGSGEGGLMSNNEYKQTGAQQGGGSLSEFKNFRAWYTQHGAQWQSSLQRGQNQTEYPQTSFNSLSELVQLCQNLQSNTINGGAA